MGISSALEWVLVKPGGCLAKLERCGTASYGEKADVSNPLFPPRGLGGLSIGLYLRSAEFPVSRTEESRHMPAFALQSCYSIVMQRA